MKSNSEAVFVFPGCDTDAVIFAVVCLIQREISCSEKKTKRPKNKTKEQNKQNKTKQSETTTSVSYGASPKYPHTKKY